MADPQGLERVGVVAKEGSRQACPMTLIPALHCNRGTGFSMLTGEVVHVVDAASSGQMGVTLGI